MNKKNNQICLLLALVIFLLSACDAFPGESSNILEGSGVVEAVEVTSSSEVSGIVLEIFVTEGEVVEVGTPLFTLKNEVLQAQYDQSVAAYEAAEANLAVAKAVLASSESNLDSAQIGLALAELNYSMVLKQANLTDAPARENSWDGETPSAFDLPSWYFYQSEELEALNNEIQDAKNDLDIELENLTEVLESISSAEFWKAEQRLSEAQAAYLVADELLDRDIESNEREAIESYVQTIFDSAEADLRSAQTEYDSLLSTEKADDVLEARARVAVARERYFVALSLAYSLQTGEESLEVTAASLSKDQAESSVFIAEGAVIQAQANLTLVEKGLEQAEAALDVISAQVEKLTINSPASGVVLTSTIEVGELVQPGMTAVVVGQLDDLSITVYLQEDVYGAVNLGDKAEVRVDSYPDLTFQAEVVRIADKAEYTPRNVQTQEDRRTTVFAIKLSVIGDDGKLKPGMPADVTFIQ